MDEDWERRFVKNEIENAKRTLEIKRLEIPLACILEVEAGTNCPAGGDWGHGGRTYFKLKNSGGVGWVLKVRDRKGEYYFEDPIEIELLLGGDMEHDAFVIALDFAKKVLTGESVEEFYEEYYEPED